jgi:hypothetical protein
LSTVALLGYKHSERDTSLAKNVNVYTVQYDAEKQEEENLYDYQSNEGTGMNEWVVKEGGTRAFDYNDAR